MITIHLLNNEWKYDQNNPLGPSGGFGAVYLGKGKNNDAIAVKRLHLNTSNAAHRELNIANALMHRSLNHVMPVFDSGQDTESGYYFVIMPVAEKSLQDEINRAGKLKEKDAALILLEIAQGLNEVEEIVHRDLKPGNVLFHDGTWKVADFGIARFVEETTSLRTLKDFLSPQYASPEQWRMERATHATDIYALGCIAYTLLTGNSPFHGETIEDFREAHLFQQPPPIIEIEPRLRTLVAMTLRKNSSGRPSLERVIRLLEEVVSSSDKVDAGRGLESLAQVGASAAEEENYLEVIKSKLSIKTYERLQLARDAFQILQDITEYLSNQITNLAPSAVINIASKSILSITLGTATIEVNQLKSGQPIEEGVFVKSNWDVVAAASIIVRQTKPTAYRWGANIWYSNLGSDSEFRWWEVSYFNTGRSRINKYFNYEPFALEDSAQDFLDADLAASTISHVINIATKPRAIDDENIEQFCDRWAELLAKAYRGQLLRPNNLPII